MTAFLSQAVEDTARNILAQEKQRYSPQIEALQLLLLQTHHQLTTLQQWQQQPQHWGPGPSHPSALHAPKPAPRGQHVPREGPGVSLAGSNPPSLLKQLSPGSPGSRDNLFGSPPAARLHSGENPIQYLCSLLLGCWKVLRYGMLSDHLGKFLRSLYQDAITGSWKRTSCRIPNSDA